MEILFGKLRPYLAKVHKAIKDGIAFGDLLVFRPKKILHNQFVFYIMSSYRFIHYVNSSTYGTKMPRVSPDYIRNIFIPIPPRDEQIQIINYLDKKTTQIDKAIKLQEEQIKKLKEYKTSLIDSVVTGKILIKGELDAY